MFNGRVVFADTFDDQGWTDENTLARGYQTKPDTISAVVTHLGGRESDKFPLTFLTEGQKGGAEYIEIQDAQFWWDVMRRDKKTDMIARSDYNSYDQPGLNNTVIITYFKTRWLIEQHPIVSQSGVKARIAAAPTMVGDMYRYELELTSPNPLAFCPVEDLAIGAKWGMVGNGLVSESGSKGNRSNVQMPGKMTNQISFMRKSYRYEGNLANKYVEVEFMVEGNRKTKKWLDFEEWKHEMMWRENCEEHLWESEFNRNANGVIMLKDRNTGKPIPIGAGVFEQIPNSDTYGILTYDKINNVVGDAAYGATDTENMTFVFYGGKGFLRDFDAAMKEKAGTFTQITGDKFVTGTGRNLVLGGFFKAFEHVDGHYILVKWLPLLDFGGRAQAAPKHPITGFPMTSHEGYVVDQSNYDGQKNVKMIVQKGRSLLKGVVKGMAPLNGQSKQYGYSSVGSYGGDMIADETDANAIHYLGSKVINIMRNEHCVSLKCVLS